MCVCVYMGAWLCRSVHLVCVWTHAFSVCGCVHFKCVCVRDCMHLLCVCVCVCVSVGSVRVHVSVTVYFLDCMLN